MYQGHGMDLDDIVNDEFHAGQCQFPDREAATSEAQQQDLRCSS